MATQRGYRAAHDEVAHDPRGPLHRDTMPTMGNADIIQWVLVNL
jgi:hypothetical protein